MPFVRDWGSINPMTGIAAGVAGYFNALKANTSQSRLLQFQANQQRDANIGNAISGAISPLAYGLAGRMLSTPENGIDPTAMMLVGAGINPRMVGSQAFGDTGFNGMNRAGMTSYGATPDVAAQIGRQVLSQPDELRMPHLSAYGLTGEQYDALPDAQRHNIDLQTGYNITGSMRAAEHANAWANAKQQLEQQQFENGIESGQYTIPPDVQQKLNSNYVAQQQALQDHPQLADQINNAFKQQRTQITSSVPRSAYKPVNAPPPQFDTQDGSHTIIQDKKGQLHVVKKEVPPQSMQHKPGEALPPTELDGRPMVADQHGVPQPVKGSKSNDELAAEYLKLHPDAEGTETWNWVKEFRAAQNGKPITKAPEKTMSGPISDVSGRIMASFKLNALDPDKAVSDSMKLIEAAQKDDVPEWRRLSKSDAPKMRELAHSLASMAASHILQQQTQQIQPQAPQPQAAPQQQPEVRTPKKSETEMASPWLGTGSAKPGALYTIKDKKTGQTHLARWNAETKRLDGVGE